MTTLLQHLGSLDAPLSQGMTALGSRRSSIPISLYNGCVVIAVVAVLLDDNRPTVVAIPVAVVIRTDRYANRANPDANVFCCGG
jgi:hypothetical protein